jgi:PAS domain S-box-containing protein
VTFDVAASPAVRLAEISEWAALLDRHSVVSLDALEGCTRVVWSNVPGVPADPRECEFRLGALEGLLAPSGEPSGSSVEHVACAGRGAARCVFMVEGMMPEADPLHARLLRESFLLESSLQGREAVFRRLATSPAHQGRFPDLAVVKVVRRIIEEIEDVVLIFDPDLSVLDANRAGVRFSGTSLDALRGLSARDLFSAESYDLLHSVLGRLVDVGFVRGLVLEGRGEKGWVPLEVSARVTGDRRAILCIARDISQHLELERELEERNRQLADQNQRIREADLLKSEFLANVSHELNTPLTCIRGFAKLLRRDIESENSGDVIRLPLAKRLEFLHIVENEASRMGDLIGGLLELSKIEAGVATLDREIARLNDIVTESLLILKPRLDERGLVVDLKLDEGLPEVQLDTARMKQVVLNLVDNAIKFSEIGGNISARTAAVEDGLELRVGNSSGELSHEQLERIFERFVQRDGSFTRPHGGVGLGLNLVRAIAQMHGGAAWGEITRPGWVEFVVRIPLA